MDPTVDAYAQIGSPERRAVYDALQRHLATVQSVRTPPMQPMPPVGVGNGARASGGDPGVLDFGRYTGWSLAQIAQSDPDYLLWLARHSSGIRYRRRIEALLEQKAGTLRASPDRKRGR